MSLAFFSCDWGTTHFRVRRVGPGGSPVLAEFVSPDGVARLAQGAAEGRGERFLATLARALAGLKAELQHDCQGAPIVISGMASSSIGWQELPYSRLPLPLDGQDLTWRELPPLDGHRVALISGVCSETDVLRGEETQAIGAFCQPSQASLAKQCLLILPGTHSKHLTVDDGALTHFQTFMTGELFAVLTEHSLLRHSLEITPAESSNQERESLCAGVARSLTLPLTAALFQVRTRHLLAGQLAASNRAFLSGVLLGAELSYLRDAAWADRALLLCAPHPLVGSYQVALEALGLSSQLHLLPPEEQELLTARGQAVVLRQIGWA